MREWNPDHTGLRELLEEDDDAYAWYLGLPYQTRTALRRQESVTSFAEMQSITAYERESQWV